jgi:hypothetical protein
MMHMTKGYHEEEVELVEQQFMQMMKGGSALDCTMSVGTSSCPQSPDLVPSRAPVVNGGRKR